MSGMNIPTYNFRIAAFLRLWVIEKLVRLFFILSLVYLYIHTLKHGSCTEKADGFFQNFRVGTGKGGQFLLLKKCVPPSFFKMSFLGPKF